MYKINQPPVGTTVTSNPTTQELASKSLNRMTKTRRSLNGRRLLVSMNDFPQDLVNSRKAICDVYPPGTDPAIDADQDRSGGYGHPPQ